jgi:hypothetical protein
MLRLVLVASLLAGCRISLESNDTTSSGQRPCMVSTTAQPCLDAAAMEQPPLAWIESKIFVPQCNFSGCHGSATDAGKLDLRPGMSHAHLVGVSSMIDRTRKLVVPNDVEASYLMLMLRDVGPAMAVPPAAAPPGNIGYMPQSAPTLCCQKLDAIERWINDGAPNN